MTEQSTDKVTNLFRLDGKIVVVTGGVGILGRNYCSALSEMGATVVIADLDEEHCKSLAEEIQEQTGGNVVGISVNLASEESIKSWASSILDRFGNIDVLVNNAAAKTDGFFAPLEDYSLDTWNQVMAVNVTGIFLTVRELGAAMAKQGHGSIINIASIYGVVGPDQRIYEGSYYEDLGGAINTPMIYSASKGAVISMTRYLATYWGRSGVRINALTPGGVESGQNEEFSQRYSDKVPMGRMAKADEMIGALLYLASDASSYVNGQNIIVDGGWTAW